MTKCIRVSDEAYDVLRRAARKKGLPVPALVEALAKSVEVGEDVVVIGRRRARAVPKEYFEKLLRENSELKAELNRLRAALKRVGDEQAAIRGLREERERLAEEVERLRAEAEALSRAKARLMGEAGEMPVNPERFISALREHGLLVEVKRMLVGLRSDAGKYLVGDDTYYAIYLLRDEILRADPAGDAPVKKRFYWIL